MPQPHPNRLLAAIPTRSRKHLLSNSVEVELATTTVLHEARSHPSHAFFITSGLASVLAVTTLGLSAEVGMVGREGFIGSLHLIGPADTPTHCRMQLAGAAIRIPMEHLQKAFEQDEAIHRRVLEFVQAQSHALSQVAGCHRIHGASERLTRWLLHAQDLTESSTIDITQETLSELLGTKRVTIAAAAGELQRQGLIEYRRGHIRLLDLAGLEAIACDCYSTLKELHKGLYGAS
ncbi:MAG: Crp/Fnr family transcriptional regulator [Janthinobacterium lividum]